MSSEVDWKMGEPLGSRDSGQQHEVQLRAAQSAALQGLIVKAELFNISISDWGDGADWTLSSFAGVPKLGGGADPHMALPPFRGTALLLEKQKNGNLVEFSRGKCQVIIGEENTDSSQWCPVKEQEEMGMDWNTGCSIKAFYFEGDWMLQAAPETCGVSIPGVKLSWTWPWGTCPTWPCFEQGGWIQQSPKVLSNLSYSVVSVSLQRLVS